MSFRPKLTPVSFVRFNRLAALMLLIVLSVDIAAAVQQIMVDASSRADTLSTILPSPVVMDVADDKDCMSVLLAALLHALDLVARCLIRAFPPMLFPQGTSSTMGGSRQCSERPAAQRRQ